MVLFSVRCFELQFYGAFRCLHVACPCLQKRNPFFECFSCPLKQSPLWVRAFRKKLNARRNNLPSFIIIIICKWRVTTTSSTVIFVETVQICGYLWIKLTGCECFRLLLCSWQILTRPSPLSLSVCVSSSNSLKNQICVQWAWDDDKNQLLDWCQTSCGQLALLFLPLPCFSSPPHHLSLFCIPLRLFFGHSEKKNKEISFVTLQQISHLSIHSTVWTGCSSLLATLKSLTFDIPLQLCMSSFFFTTDGFWEH